MQNPFWERLFVEGGSAPESRKSLRLIRKQGNPFLLLPMDAALAARVLELYPAQTRVGRIARTALRLALRAHLPVRAEKIELPFSPTNSLARFLAESIGQSHPENPTFGILPGNPNSPGQRLIFLVFNRQKKPAAIVKAGLTSTARELIRREHEILSAGQATAMPRLRGFLDSSDASALAFDFFPGHSPVRGEDAVIPHILESWLRPAEKSSALETRPWTELRQAGNSPALLAELERKLGERPIGRALYHGDFTPWNVKVYDGQWTVLDWERGDWHGLPGWDWFHYEIQRAILVERPSTAKLIDRVESLLASDPFQRYAGLGGIAGGEREMLLAYLLHHCEVIRPAEGLHESRELLKALVSRRHRKSLIAL